ncbi:MULTISPECIES: succinylglutamate desuccinylase [Brenneria]|uniref:Succinylglutamate desuccinylase n=1 Tax=Brenneria nigrifluens DSM 30175 = ATCC 13028 TaxID=1121120 RepID=A0A2U1USV3_9GAMM|nr:MULTISPECIES: succinylglutamate desuccinylase [Brenneria]EHD21719.1 Succinylglutamate desuccinylase [Brenneria sp. EniD312]PWC24745.1 succinylglutamate desuccinylase [Brenneria nigrifluens DSM 30175 = ATCC 13028]QCR04832.1 succinylglutamate desuccinylase [Brenneria nigrifluens DSM 30175 = ATCC 13028]
MNDFLALTLRGALPRQTSGETAGLHWRWWREGVLELAPDSGYQRAVVLSAGIHGNETAPIELLDRLVNDLLAGRQGLAVRLLVVLGNPAAMRAGRRYLHSDMNRMFGGRHAQFAPSGETARARELEQVMTAFFAADAPENGAARRHYDLHTAIRDSKMPRFGLLPYQQRPYSAALLDCLTAAGLDALVVHSEPGGTFSHFSSERLQAGSCTLELGKARAFGCNDPHQFSAIDRALRAEVSAMALPARSGPPPAWFRVARSLIKHGDAFRLHLADDTANFTCFEQGTLLCEQPGELYRVKHDREWILFPNPNVAPGLRAGLVLTEMAPDGLAVL